MSESGLVLLSLPSDAERVKERLVRKAAAQRARRRADPERIRAVEKAHRDANKDRLNAQRRQREAAFVASHGHSRYATEDGRKLSLLRTRRWRANHPEHRPRQNERSIWSRREKKYGISKAAFDVLFQVQLGKCASCEDSLAGGHGTHVDHDHVTGRVRGLLCGPCNSGLGLFCDDARRLLAAVAYLKKSKT